VSSSNNSDINFDRLYATYPIELPHRTGHVATRVCKSDGMSPISSRNSVPVSAVRIGPAAHCLCAGKCSTLHDRTIPIRAVFRDGSGVDGDQTGCRHVAVRDAVHGRTSSLPVPDSPLIKTVACERESLPSGTEYFLHGRRLPNDLGRFFHDGGSHFSRSLSSNCAANNINCLITSNGFARILKGTSLECGHCTFQIGMKRS